MRLLIVISLLCAILGQSYGSSFNRTSHHASPRSHPSPRYTIFRRHTTPQPTRYYNTSRPYLATPAFHIQHTTRTSHINNTHPVDQEIIHTEQAHHISTRSILTNSSHPAGIGTSSNRNSNNVLYTQQSNNSSNYSPKTVFQYNYHPSPQISYGNKYYPVYQGHPPAYVYEYQNSGSRFNNLLTGLALYNLGLNSYYDRHWSYKPYINIFGEICKLGISDHDMYVETRINCDLMSSFIWANSTSMVPELQYVLNKTTEVTVTMTNSIVEDALEMKGPSVEVTPGMACYVIRTWKGITVLQKPVNCGLLQEYAERCFHRNVAQCLIPFKTIIFNLLIILYLVRY